MPKSTDKPKWIWIASACRREDCYLRARRVFTLDAKPAAARLRITAFSEYALYVNGQYVGCGPASSDFESPQADVYTEAELPLVRGKNVLAVLAHNPYVGLPRRPRLPGGLWAELVLTGERGVRTPEGGRATWHSRPRLCIVTDSRWRVAAAEDFSARAPRLYWTAGFAEVRDLRREPRGWTMPGFSDRRWAEADEVKPEGPQGARSPRVRDRVLSRLTERFVAPAAVAAAGRSRWPAGTTAIPFEFSPPKPGHGEYYAGTFVQSKTRRRMRLVFDCDESAAVYINNRQALRQGYKEEFLRWLGPEEQDDYAGIHRGQGQRAETAEVELQPGWNSLGVVIYDPGSSWGFALHLADPRTGEAMPVEFSPDQKAHRMADWHVVCEQICPCGDGWIPDTPGPNARTFPDPAYQLSWETPVRNRQAARGAQLILAGAEAGGRLSLRDGEFVAYDLGGETVGYIELDLEGPPGAILDIAWSEGLDTEDGPSASLRAGLAGVRRGMRQADRLILAGERQTVRLFNRRALRFLELVARTGGDTVTVHRLGVWETSRMAEPPAVPQADDRDLAAAMSLVARTIRCTVQDTLEGSPAREAEQSIPAAMFLSQAERIFGGRTEMGEAALRAFAADQGGDGFFRAIVPAGTQHVVPDWNLLWVIWLADHVAWTGDKSLAKDLYPVAERVLDWTATFRDNFDLLENRPDRAPWWLFVDLGPIEKHGVVTAWQALYARALRAAADVADFIGMEEEGGHGRNEADAIGEAARRRLWSDARGLFVDTRLFEHPSRRASPQTNYYALYGGLATDEQADRILGNLWTADGDHTVSWGSRENPFVKYFALEALFERGRAKEALSIIRRYWGAMARAGLTTVPEVFPLTGAKAKGDGDGYAEGPYGRRPPEVLCHAWGVHPAALLARWVLGVHPEGPGFAPLRFAPMPGNVGPISGTLWTPKGMVGVSIGRDPSASLRAGGRGRKIRATFPQDMPYRLDRRHLADDDRVEVLGGKAV
jgi:hypothetical protein